MLALSTDSIYSHKVFTQVSPSAKQVQYPLLSDRSGYIPWIYGALDTAQGVARRTTVLIDPDGKIAAWMAYPPEVGRGTAEILRMVQAAQFSRETGLGAPANWMPGDPGLKRDIRRAGTV